MVIFRSYVSLPEGIKINDGVLPWTKPSKGCGQVFKVLNHRDTIPPTYSKHVKRSSSCTIWEIICLSSDTAYHQQSSKKISQNHLNSSRILELYEFLPTWSHPSLPSPKAGRISGTALAWPSHLKGGIRKQGRLRSTSGHIVSNHFVIHR